MDIKIEDCEIEERNEPNHNKEMESENSNTNRGNIMRDSHKTSCFHCGKGILLSQVAVHLKVFHSEFHCHCCNSIVDVNNMNDFRQFKNITEDLKPLNTSTIKSKEITNNNEQNRKNVVHECVICKKRFSNECDLPEHLKQMHCPSVVLNKTKEFQCQFCGLDFLTKSLLKIHLESFHKSSEGQPGKPPVLDIVPLEINVTGELSDSDNFAKEEEEYLPVNEIVDSKEDFEIENIKLSYKFSMSNHKIISNKEIEEAEVVINGKTRYQCKTCEKHLFSRKSFTDHLRIHTGEKPYTCHVCGRQFRLSSQLTRHVQDVHERIKKHPCDICGRKFANGVALRDHKTIHTGERTMLCHLCGKAFKTKAALYMHSKFHAEVYAHPCPHCNKGFRTKEHLNNHMLRHTGERPYACEHCGKRFFMSKTLHNHILIHTNNQTYKCSECGKHFAQERYLKNHERNHRKRALKLNNTTKQ